MELYAQHGYGEADKIVTGLNRGLISGVIYGGKDIAPDKLVDKLGEIEASCPRGGRLYDPQYYVKLFATEPNIKLGKLEDYPYFDQVRRSQLEDSEFVGREIRRVLEFQTSLNVTHIIAPNIYISSSFDSGEAVIAKNFIRKSREIYNSFDDRRPLLTTLAVARNALLNSTEFEAFLDDITLLDSPPDGFYILIGASNVAASMEILNTDTISAWMFLTYALKINGFTVVNGYSDVVSPFLGAVGGDIGCSGWHSNLRRFSIERWLPEAAMKRRPRPRYLSTKLLNRVAFYEFDGLKKVLPDVVNGLDSDRGYEDEPSPLEEILQSWEAIDFLLGSLASGDTVRRNLEKCADAIETAEGLYATIAASYPPLEKNSDNRHLEQLREGVALFREKAEI